MNIGFKDGSSHEKRFDMRLFWLVGAGFFLGMTIAALEDIALSIKKADTRKLVKLTDAMFAAAYIILTIIHLESYFTGT